MTDRFPGRPGDGAFPSDVGPRPAQDIEAIASRLGISVERVLIELAKIGFARITDIVEWDERGLRFTDSERLSEDDRAAIAEVVASAGDKKPYRIKMHDKRPALELLGRCIGMFGKSRHPRKEDEQHRNDGEDPRELLARKIARIIKPGTGDPASAGNAAG